jgi:tRNA threonylcarbamoyladenosine biosynthesis protein TsaE
LEIETTITCKTARATQQLAARIGSAVAPGTVIALVGELGAGKTSFVQGLARGLGVLDLRQVLSPTYTLVNEYPGKGTTLVHIDLYRLKDLESARALGLEEQLSRRDAVIAVEWADLLPELLPPEVVRVELEQAKGGGRRITVRGLKLPKGPARR